jgi:hypothetical protein
MRHITILLLSTLQLATAVAQQASTVSVSERETSLAAIKKWSAFDGTWEGELRYVFAPKKDWLDQRQPFKVTFNNGQPKVYYRHGIRDWSELGATYRVHQPDELTVVIHSYGAGGVWTENCVVILTRRTENTGEVFIQRVVNNWAGKPLPGEDSVYGDTRTGSVIRKTFVSNTAPTQPSAD